MVEAPRTFGWLNGLGLLTMIKRELVREVRSFHYTVLGPALQATLFALVFQLSADQEALATGSLSFIHFLIPGLVLSAVMHRSFEAGAYSLMDDKTSERLQDILGIPLTALELLASYSLASIAVSFTTAFLVWAILCVVGEPLYPAYPGLVVAYALLASILFSAFGLLAAIFSPKWDSIAGKETFILMPALFLSGTFFPLAAVPDVFQIVLQANPVFYLVDGFRFAMTGYHDADPVLGLTVATLATLGLWIMALALLMRGYKLKS